MIILFACVKYLTNVPDQSDFSEYYVLCTLLSLTDSMLKALRPSSSSLESDDVVKSSGIVGFLGNARTPWTSASRNTTVYCACDFLTDLDLGYSDEVDLRTDGS